MARLRLAVVGVGHLGQAHARILSGFPDVDLVGVCDVDVNQARTVAQRHGSKPFSDHRPLVGGVDAAVIVVPTCHHRAVAADFLERGIPLLVEKPLARTLCEAQELVQTAQKRGALLQVGHVERFNPAFERLKEQGPRPKLIHCQRLGPYTGRSTDIGVVLDLMIHDIDLVLALTESAVVSVQATGVALMGGHEDVASARLEFANGSAAQMSVSRVHTSSVRRTDVWGDGGHASVDYAKRHLTLVRPGADGSPSVSEWDGENVDQLTRELREFVDCVQIGGRPRVDGGAALEAVAVADRILSAIGTTREAQTLRPAA
jgi:predicted dehydrogenase